jgi:hypothetical protein
LRPEQLELATAARHSGAFLARYLCVVLGPYAKKSYVSHTLSSHVSLVAFVEQLWALPPSPNADAKRRTAKDTAMRDCYDLKQNPLAPPNLP